jgi:hypothetical protein
MLVVSTRISGGAVMVSNYQGMSEHEAAGIIDRAFPKHPVFCKVEAELSVVDLMDALFIAKKKCRSYKLGDCIKWSREVIYGKK